MHQVIKLRLRITEFPHHGFNIIHKKFVVRPRLREKHRVNVIQGHAVQKICPQTGTMVMNLFVEILRQTTLLREIPEVMPAIGAIVHFSMLTMRLAYLVEHPFVQVSLIAVLHAATIIDKGVADENDLLAVKAQTGFRT
jgi:hypothetical protein